MQWTDEGIVLGTRRLGEGNAILELLTRDHGRHLGLVRGGGGSRLNPVLQPGNTVSATWRARLDDHLGHYVIEGLDLRAASSIVGLCGLWYQPSLLSLPAVAGRRDPRPSGCYFEELTAIVSTFGDLRMPPHRW